MLKDALELMRSTSTPSKAKAIERQLHDFYGGSGFTKHGGLVQYRKDDMRLIAALEAMRCPAKEAPGGPLAVLNHL